MKVEIDLSGRIEKTEEGSALAFASKKNIESYSVFISGWHKRRLLHELRKKDYLPETLHLKIFCGLLFFLLEPYWPKISTVVLDQEYTGKEGGIFILLEEIFKAHGLIIKKENFCVRRIGKISPAHKKALVTFRDLRKAGKIISSKAVLEVLSRKKIGSLRTSPV